MNRLNHLIQIGFISGIIGIISEYFGSVRVSYIVLLVLISIDTFTGVLKAVKYQRFSSSGFIKLFSKIILYSLSILTVRLLEIGLDSFINTTLLSQITVAMLAIAESISILENLTLLGVPLPSNFIKKLFGDLVLPIVGKVTGNTSYIDKYILEINDIIKYTLPTFNDDCMKHLLIINFEVWKNVAMQINNALTEKESKNNDLIFYKVKVLVQSAFNETREKWAEDKISDECIERFNINHQHKVNAWMKKVNDICFSQNDIQVKKEQLIESIVVLLYQTIVDAKKISV